MKFFIFCLFSIFLFAGYAHSSYLSILEDHIEEEKEVLKQYDEDIVKIKQLIAKKKLIDSLYTSGFYEKARTYFNTDFIFVASAYENKKYQLALKKILFLENVYSQKIFLQKIIFEKAKCFFEINKFYRAKKKFGKLYRQVSK